MRGKMNSEELARNKELNELIAQEFNISMDALNSIDSKNLEEWHLAWQQLRASSSK